VGGRVADVGAVLVAAVVVLVEVEEDEHPGEGVVRVLLHRDRGRQTGDRELGRGEVGAAAAALPGVVAPAAIEGDLLVLEVGDGVGDRVGDREAGADVVGAAGGLEQGQGLQGAAGAVGVGDAVAGHARVLVDQVLGRSVHPGLIGVVHAHVAAVRAVPVGADPLLEEAEHGQAGGLPADAAILALLHPEVAEHPLDGGVDVLVEGRHERVGLAGEQQDADPEQDRQLL